MLTAGRQLTAQQMQTDTRPTENVGAVVDIIRFGFRCMILIGWPFVRGNGQTAINKFAYGSSQKKVSHCYRLESSISG